jgi:serine/threonine protein phosphatase PrpC
LCKGYVLENGRVNGVLAVARSIGDFYLHPYVSVEPFLSRQIDLEKEQIEFLIFACDGVFDVISDEMACDIVRQSINENPENPHLAASVLRDKAYLYGSRDNISVIVVIF